jgi:hypothetical protein
MEAWRFGDCVVGNRCGNLSRVPLVGIRCLTETARKDLDLFGLLMEVADKPDSARSLGKQA